MELTTLEYSSPRVGGSGFLLAKALRTTHGADLRTVGRTNVVIDLPADDRVVRAVAVAASARRLASLAIGLNTNSNLHLPSGIRTKSVRPPRRFALCAAIKVFGQTVNLATTSPTPIPLIDFSFAFGAVTVDGASATIQNTSSVQVVMRTSNGQLLNVSCTLSSFPTSCGGAVTSLGTGPI